MIKNILKKTAIICCCAMPASLFANVNPADIMNDDGEPRVLSQGFEQKTNDKTFDSIQRIDNLQNNNIKKQKQRAKR